MSIDEQHIALPKLYGAPAYARPAPVVASTPRPFDPDDLPIEAAQTEDDRAYASDIPGRTWSGPVPATAMDGSRAGSANAQSTTDTGLRPRSFSLKSITGRFLGGD